MLSSSPKTTETTDYRQLYIEHLEGELTPREIKRVENLCNGKGFPNKPQGLLSSIYKKLGGFHYNSYLKEKMAIKAKKLPEPTTHPEPISISQKISTAIQELTNEVGSFEDADDSWSMPENDSLDKFREVSPMNIEALNSPETIGIIDPPLQGSFITKINLPLPQGFKPHSPTETEIENHAIEVPSFEDEELYEEQNGDTRIDLPITSFTTPLSLPTPYAQTIVSCDTEESWLIQPPNKTYPLVSLKLEEPEDETLTYFIRQQPQEKADPKHFTPSQEEQTYWKQVLPLPGQIRQQCLDYPEYAASIIVSYVTQNFSYACHNRLGDFIINNSDDLPLLMDELRMGHCDLLSWVETAYLRSLGIPAFAVECKITNQTGTAFMKKYNHAYVGIVTPNGQIKFHDPTINCEFPTKLQPKNLSDHEIEQLENNYNKCESEQEKRDVLRRFLKQLSKTPPQATPSTTDDINAFKTLLTPSTSEFLIETISETLDKPATRTTSNPRLSDQTHISEEYSSQDIAEVYRKRKTRIFEELEELLYYRDGIESMPEIDDPAARKMLQLFINYYNSQQLDIPSPSCWTRADTEVIGKEVNIFAFNKEESWSERFLALLKCLHRYLKIKPELKPTILAARSINDLPIQPDLIKDLISLMTEQDGDLNLSEPANIVRAVEINPNFSFSDRFKQGIKNCDPSNFKDSIISAIRGENDTISPTQTALNAMLEIPFFMHLVVRSFKDQQLREKLKSDLGIDEKFFRDFANYLQPIKNGKGRIEKPDLAILRAQRSTEELMDEKYFYQIMEPLPKERAKALTSLKEILKKIDHNKKRQMGAPQPESWELIEYTTDMPSAWIEWKATARLGKPIAKKPELQKSYSEPLHIYLDTENSDSNAYISSHSTLETLITGLQIEARKGREIYITSENSNLYLKLSGNSRIHNPRALATLLLPKNDVMGKQKIPNQDQEKGLHNIKGELPKNLIYLSYSQGKAEAVEFQIGKKTNLVATSFEEAGLKVPCRIKDKWVKHGSESLAKIQ